MKTKPLALVVNGVERRHHGDADEPLLWVLRDRLGLTGTKYGCGVGACGACTVHVDGEAQRACAVPVGGLKGRQVTTVEHLSSAGRELHPVQRAWMELNVPQCGYCQAGQMMSAAALLSRHPKPSDAQIDAAMRGNLCRCGTYARVRAAVHRAAHILEGA